MSILAFLVKDATFSKITNQIFEIYNNVYQLSNVMNNLMWYSQSIKIFTLKLVLIIRLVFKNPILLSFYSTVPHSRFLARMHEFKQSHLLEFRWPFAASRATSFHQTPSPRLWPWTLRHSLQIDPRLKDAEDRHRRLLWVLIPFPLFLIVC